MGAIVDTLFLSQSELPILLKRYPHCHIINSTTSDGLVKTYRIIVPDEEIGDGYYFFLIENSLAMSSVNFTSRLASDKKFEERMRARLKEINPLTPATNDTNVHE